MPQANFTLCHSEIAICISLIDRVVKRCCFVILRSENVSSLLVLSLVMTSRKLSNVAYNMKLVWLCPHAQWQVLTITNWRIFETDQQANIRQNRLQSLPSLRPLERFSMYNFVFYWQQWTATDLPLWGYIGSLSYQKPPRHHKQHR